MTYFGWILKKWSPKLYDILTISVLKTRDEDVFYIMDAFGSFKEYFAENSIGAKMKKLLSGLDDNSKNTCKTIYSRLSNYPDSSCKQYIPVKENEIIGGVLEEENFLFDQYEIKKKRRLFLKSGAIHSSAFYFFHGLSLLPPAVKSYVAGKQMLDLGAFHGDSVLAMQDYDFSKIFSVEMSPSAVKAYLKVMRENKVSADRYQIINCAVSDTEKIARFEDSGLVGTSLANAEENDNYVSVEQTTVDSLTEKYQINDLAFVKADVEGFALEVLRGGIDSIKKQRPVLSIAIYHSPKEFFEVKPFLEDNLKDYTFMIRRLAYAKEYGACHAETVLLAYPNELRE